MLVRILIDPMGCGERTAEQEVEDIKELLKEDVLPEETLRFQVAGLFGSKSPDAISCEKYFEGGAQVYVLDYGGLMPGADGLIESNVREFIHCAQNNPSAVFLIHSHYTFQWYQKILDNEVKNEFGSSLPNVFRSSGFDAWENKARAWLGLSPIDEE